MKLWAVYPEGECRTETCDLQKEPPLGLRRGFPCLFLAEEEPKHYSGNLSLKAAKARLGAPSAGAWGDYLRMQPRL